ncbi:putative DNA-binding domain-containing protein [Lysobacter sp. K5869]|uniref:HvfC family RiPP maturation protein n=1 Tax=Lysobacter sp. K5869 TaxID=2820808 RepID=UPI001C0627C3|nr:putative DNA-binding domain-containing protein [Lysobacter sp. K5869]QWP74977.1 putative DNA-binding domain-containing protein [Lysobacter sp. K5869]
MSERLRRQQFALTRHLRDPNRYAPPPGIEERRLRIYRELLIGSVEGLLAGGFPVLRATLGEASWRALVRRFYAAHRCATPLFPQVGGEFVQFLQSRRGAVRGLPWLAELAHYEWAEAAVLSCDDATPAHDRDGDLLAGAPLLAPWAQPLAYRWPVQRIGPEYQPRRAPNAPTLLLVHRDGEGDAQFSELAPLSYRLLDALRTQRRSGAAHLRALAAEAGAPADALLEDGRIALEQWRAQGVVLGTAHDIPASQPSAPRSRP